MDGNMVRLSAEYSKSKKARALPLTGALGNAVGLLLQVLLAPLHGRRQVVVTDYVVLPINRISRVSGKLRAPTDRPF